MIDSKYLIFNRVQFREKKTPNVDIYSKSSGVLLGQIKWYSPWRQFCFFPTNNTIFNTGCMRDIEAQIVELMNERKNNDSN